MAILTWAIQQEDSPAHAARLLASVLLNEGVVGVADDSFEVLEDTGSNLNCRIGSGTVGDLAVVQGDSQADQGVYVLESQDATDTLTLSAGDNSDPRIDLIVIRVQDDEADSGGQNASILDVVEGTPASSPSAPALPDNCLLLAEVEVAAQASTVTNSDITDMRVEAYTSGQLVETLTFDPAGSPYTFTKADYPWLRAVRVRVQAGGGGGGGAGVTGSSESAQGGGGGGGGYAEAFVLAGDLGSSETVTVGAGGARTAGGTGGTGGASSFGTHAVTAGGVGGDSQPGSSSQPRHGAAGGAGGNASAGDILIAGQPGGIGVQFGQTTITHAPGGNSQLGSSPAPTRTASGSLSGSDITSNELRAGAGGRGSANLQNQSDTNPDTGGPGVVHVDLYA